MVTRRDKRDRQPNPNFTNNKGNLIDDDIIIDIVYKYKRAISYNVQHL